MTQYNLPTINPATDSGTSLSGFLNLWRPAVVSQHAGPIRPTYAVAGTIWYDTDISKPFYFNGSADIGFATSSDLTGYLPMAGGTLTGPLGGTTAQFSATMAAGGAASAGMALTSVGPAAVVGASARYLDFQNNARAITGRIANTDTQLLLYSNNGTGAFASLNAAGEFGAVRLRATTTGAPTGGELFLGNGAFKFSHPGTGFVNWNGGLTADAYYIMNGSLFYEGTGAVASAWNGTAIAFSHPLTAPGYPSDSRLKKDVAPIPPAPSVVDAVEPCTFVYKADPEKKSHLGFLADDFVVPLPLAINRYAGTGDMPTDLMALDPMALIAQLWLELRDTRARLAVLEART